MAVTVDQANIGTDAETGRGTQGGNELTFTTTAAVATGGMIALLVSKFDNTAGGTVTASVTGPGAFTLAHSAASGNLYVALLYVFCPSGLSSGTTVTVDFTGGSVAGADVTVAAASYLGVDTSGTVVAFNAAAAGTAAWASGSVAGNSGNALIGGAGGDGTLRTSTTDAPGTERIEFNSATTGGSVTLADKLSIAGTDTLDGDWSGTLTHIGIAVAFKHAAGGTDATVTAVPATALADAPAGVITASSNVTAVPALALASAPIAVVTATGDATVTAVPATALADAPAAVLSAGATVAGVPSSALASAPPTNQIISSVVNAPAVVALASAPAAVVTAGGDATVAGVPATALADAPAGVLAADAAVAGVVGLALADAPAGVLSANAAVAGVPGVALASAPRPEISPAPAGGGVSGDIAATFAEAAA